MKYLTLAIATMIFSCAALADEAFLICSSKILGASPYVSFDFKVTSKAGRGVWGNPESATITATSSAFYGAEMAVSEPVIGCENAFITLESKSTYSINCGNEEGEGGRATLTVFSSGGVAYGSIAFPNGIKLGNNFIDETQAGWDLICRIK